MEDREEFYVGHGQIHCGLIGLPGTEVDPIRQTSTQERNIEAVSHPDEGTSAGWSHEAEIRTVLH